MLATSIFIAFLAFNLPTHHHPHYKYTPYSHPSSSPKLPFTPPLSPTMERQPSIKLQRKPSMDTEPRTLSKDDYELAWAAASVAYMQRENETTQSQVVKKPTSEIKSTTETGESSTHKFIKLPPLA